MTAQTDRSDLWSEEDLALLVEVAKALAPEAAAIARTWAERMLAIAASALPPEFRSVDFVTAIHLNFLERHFAALESGALESVFPQSLDDLLAFLRSQIGADRELRLTLGDTYRSLDVLSELVSRRLEERFRDDPRAVAMVAAYAKVSLGISKVVGSAFYEVRAEELNRALRVASSLLEASIRLHARSASVAVVLSDLTGIVCRLLRTDSSLVFLWREAEHAYAAEAGFGFGPDDLAAIQSLRFRRGDFPMMDVILGGDLAAGTRDDGRVPAELMERYGRAAYAVAPMTTSDGRRLGTLAAYRPDPLPFDSTDLEILRGVAETAALAIENAMLVEKLEQAGRLKTDFISSMSHEIRTPLNVLIGYLDMLADRHGANRHDREVLESMQRNAGYLLKLVNTILDLGRIEAGRMPLHVETFSMDEMLQALAEMFRPTAEARSLSFVCAADGPLPLLMTDRLKLLEILNNLVANAFKFTDRGSVTVRADAANGGVRFQVSDTGIGIEPESIRRIFDLFRQIGHGDRGGTGLGLYIVKRLTALLGGDISVESRPGVGTTFRLEIPDRPPT